MNAQGILFVLGIAGVLGACAGRATDPRLGPNPAGLLVDTRTTYYDITGSTAQELRTAMLTVGPRLGEYPLFAYDEWEVRWRLRPSRPRVRTRTSVQRGECRLERAEVDLTSHILLPRWKSPRQASDTLKAEWDRFLEALKKHEGGHHDLGVQAAREVLRTLRALQSYPCGTVIAHADSAAQRVLYRYHRMNVQYDEDSRFGQTQGVYWPPLTLSEVK